MNRQLLENILTLVENRIDHLRSHGDGDFYHGAMTHFEGMYAELEEVRVELESGKRVYLEDELGDVFWDYLCLLEGLEREGKISKEKVFERCWTKFSGRISPDGSNNGDWYTIKKIQKEALEKEQSIQNQ